MYDDHFGLSGRPFQLTPDPRFWFETATHRKAMAYLGYGLAQGEGFIVITGDIGAGKTTLVGHLMDTVDHQSLNAVRIVSTAIEPADLLRIVAHALGVNPSGLEKGELLLAIERGLHAVARTGKRTLLIVDEAQALPVASLEELRMLSNFQAGGHAMLQIVLLGQPEFRDRLHGEDRLEQLRQRVIAIHHLDPMEEHEVADYIAHRLAIVGWAGRPDFTESAFAAFYRGSAGVPRRLNLLAGPRDAVRRDRGAGPDRRDDRRYGDRRSACRPADDARPGDRPDPTVQRARADARTLDAPVEAHEPLVGDDESPAPVVVAADSPAEPPVRIAPSAPEPVAGWRIVAPSHERITTTIDPVAPVTEPDAPTPDIEPVAVVDEAPPVAEPAAEPLSEPDSALEFVLASPAPVAVDPPVVATSTPEEADLDADTLILQRIAALEEQVESQEAALRRVLTLLVDWVESDTARPGFAPIRNAAA